MKDPTRPPLRPPAGLVLSTPVHFIAFAGGAGLSPYAPGTVGTLVALPLWWLLSLQPWPVYGLLLAAGFVLGCWACDRSAHLLDQPDFSGIVFDEVIGIGITAFPLLRAFGPLSGAALLLLWALAFVLFRAFDILKPGPVGWADRRVGGGVGIMLDDALAGILAAPLVGLARWLL